MSNRILGVAFFLLIYNAIFGQYSIISGLSNNVDSEEFDIRRNYINEDTIIAAHNKVIVSDRLDLSDINENYVEDGGDIVKAKLEMEISGCRFEIDSQFIDKSDIDDWQSKLYQIVKKEFGKGLFFNEDTFNKKIYIVSSKVTKPKQLNDDVSFKIENTFFRNSIFQKGIYIGNSSFTLPRTVFKTNIFMDTSRIVHSKFNDLYIEDSRYVEKLDIAYSVFRGPIVFRGNNFAESKYEPLLFLKDSFQSDFSFQNDMPVRPTMQFENTSPAQIRFYRCVFTSEIIFRFRRKINKLVFDNCTFTKDAKLFIYGPLPDTICLTNLTEVEGHIYLVPPSIYTDGLSITDTFPNRIIHLDLENSDLKHIHFTYLGHFALCFANGSTDQAKTVYESLIQKFKNEGRVECVEYTDIEYKKYKYSKLGFCGCLINLVDSIWWNYGYSKWRVIPLSILLIIVFTIINYFIWDNMFRTYPINNLLAHRNNSFGWRISTRLLYTAIIFFQIKIDIEQLKLNKRRYVIWFFLQYTIGIICLGFIASLITH